MKGQEYIEDMTMYEFRLYVAGQTPKSTTVIENVKGLLKGTFDGHYNLEVIDVTEDPEIAHKDKILATPTLLRSSPPPERRVIGDLSDREKVLLYLGFTIESREIRKCKEKMDC